MYEIVNIHTYNDEFATMKKISDDLKKKRINLHNISDNGKNYEINKIYISSSNLTKLRDNYHKMYN